MRVDIRAAAGLLKAHDNILFICHSNPDGDTIGSAFALCGALDRLGKKCRVSCYDRIPAMYSFMSDIPQSEVSQPEYLVAVDVADLDLIGPDGYSASFAGKIDLCIDHHASNTFYAENTCLDEDAAAAAETVLLILGELGVKPDKDIAECIYVGLSTDTGCFRYSNTTARTLRMAADMYDIGIDVTMINKVMFETRTKSYNILESMALGGIRISDDGKYAVITVTREMLDVSGADENESHALKAIPREIEGVLVGATMTEQKDGGFRVSLRSNAPADASAICSKMGGGGHIRAAGCTIAGPYEAAYATLTGHIEEEIARATANDR